MATPEADYVKISSAGDAEKESESDEDGDRLHLNTDGYEVDIDVDFEEPTPSHGPAQSNADHLQRQLGNRQIQLIAVGGSIGTALFVSIGDALHKGGPGSLLLAFALQSVIVACVNNCVAEMTVLFPVSGGFIRMAGKWVDDALGFMAGYNFFLYQALLVPFEITALNLVLGFWSDNVPVVAVCAGTIVCYA